MRLSPRIREISKEEVARARREFILSEKRYEKGLPRNELRPGWVYCSPAHFTDYDDENDDV